MKRVTLIYLCCIFLGVPAAAHAQSVAKCFRADWLQGERTVHLMINGSKVSGTFTVGNGGDDPARGDAAYEFSGTRRGNTLTVAFAGNKLPDVAPSEMKSLLWTLVQSGDTELLRIKFSGKNYRTNRYEVRFADFAACVDDYAVLAQAAKRVQFARGANAASFPVVFKTTKARSSFLLKLKAGQQVAVVAPDCGISFYYPDKREYEEGTAIDTWGADSLPQSGDYLFVIKPVLEPGKCAVKFTVTN